MKLIELLYAGKKIDSIPKSQIPSLIGEIEEIKAQLWMRIIEMDHSEEDSRSTPKPSQIIPREQIPVPQGRIMRLPEVLKMVGLSSSTLWNMVRDGRFPKQIRLGRRSVGLEGCGDLSLD